MKENVKEFIVSLIKGIVIGSIIFIIVEGLVFLCLTAQKEQNETIYNNGVCTECGGHYEFISAAKDRQTTYYYYQCDNCKKIIEIRH